MPAIAQEMTKDMSNSRENYLDIARGVAIVSIVIYHVETQFYKGLTHLTRGYLVAIFLFLSGYFLSTKTSIAHIVKKY